MYFELAVRYHQQGDLASAKSMYAAVLENDAHHYNALVNLGLLEIRLENFREGADLFQRALAQSPEDAAVLANLALCKARMGAHDQAVLFFQKAAERDPQDLKILNHWAFSELQIGNSEKALALYELALTIDSGSKEILSNQGALLSRLGRHQAALESYEKLLQSHPGDSLTLVNKSLALTELLRYEEALEISAAIIEANPRDAQGWLAKATVLLKLQQLKSADDCYRKALALNPNLVGVQANIASIAIAMASVQQNATDPLKECSKSFAQFLNAEFRLKESSRAMSAISFFRLKHDVEQARFLEERGHGSTPVKDFIRLGSGILARSDVPAGQQKIPISEQEFRTLKSYWADAFIYQVPKVLGSCLNLENDWAAIEEAYLAASPELTYIDHFLSPEALVEFQNFSLYSKVWFKEYRQSYLGAFANQGFISPLHLQLASDLRKAMPKIFRNYPLRQLWGFKYDAKLGKGINVHADFAKVNLNFWITPDRFNLDASSGGLKVYHFPAPADWTFQDYNREPELIYQFLSEHGSDSVTIPYKENRAVLFNSALFHETDAIRFDDQYEGRRINMTYLFGSQLA